MILQKCVLTTNHDLKELYPQGTLEFPCSAYESAHTDQPADMIPWHWHEELEIIYIKKGTLKVLIPSQEYALTAGTLVVLNNSVLHSVTSDSYGELQSFVFSSLLLTGSNTSSFYLNYLQPLMACSGFQLLQSSDPAVTNAFLLAFDAMQKEAFAYEFTVREQLSHILLFCFSQLKDQLYLQNTAQHTDDSRIEKMLEYIQLHYTEQLTLKMIADSVGLGERECLRCFKRTIKESPIQYLLKYRLMQSAVLLRSKPSASIAEIANDCGFDHPSYYAQQFKRFYRCTPRDYREKNPQ